METRATLNDIQKRMVDLYDVPLEKIAGKNWFNDYYHLKAFDYLRKNKNLSMDDAFAILDNLDAAQAIGLCRGLTRDEVIGLTSKQIDKMIVLGLSHDEVAGLNEFQIDAYFKLKHKGLTPDQLRQSPWFNSREYVSALGFLLTINNKKIDEALDELSKLNKLQASAICYGFGSYFSKGLDDVAITTLVEAYKFKGISTVSQVKGLNQTQINIMKELSHWNISSDDVCMSWLNSDAHYKALCHLIKERFFSFNDAITEIKDLNQTELKGIQNGLSRNEVEGLNEHQIEALYTCKTAKNGLNTAMLKGKDWFNSEDHDYAFNNLINSRLYTPEQALAELDGLNAAQAKQIYDGESRENVIGLNEFMLAAIKENKASGLQAKHLKDKPWFNSDDHVRALTKLIKKKSYFIGAFDNEMLAPLEKMNQAQLKFVGNGIAPDKVNALSPIQIKLVTEMADKLYDTGGLINATWLQTEDQYLLFSTLYNQAKYNHGKVLDIVEYATQQNQVKQFYLDALNRKIQIEDWKKPRDDNHNRKIVDAKRNYLNAKSTPTFATKDQSQPQNTSNVIYRMYSTLVNAWTPSTPAPSTSTERKSFTK